MLSPETKLGCGTVLACAAMPAPLEWLMILTPAIVGAYLSLGDLPEGHSNKEALRAFIGGLSLSIATSWPVAAWLEDVSLLPIRFILCAVSLFLAWKAYKPIGAVLETVFRELPLAAIAWVKKKWLS